MKIRFLHTRTVVDGAGAVERRFEAGLIYDLEPASAERWLRRGIAEAVGQEDETAAVEEGEEATEGAPRRRGRPPK